MPRPIKRSKRNVGKRVVCLNPESLYHRRIGRLLGFRGDQEPGNPYCMVYFDSTGAIETISAKQLRYYEP